MSLTVNAVSRGRAADYVPLISCGIIGALPALIAPIIISHFSSMPEFGPQSARLIGGCDTIGAAVGTLVAAAVLDRFNWRQGAIAAIAILTAINAASAMAVTPLALASARVMAGMFEGLLLAICNAGLARMPHPERSLASQLIAIPLAASASLKLADLIGATHGASSIYWLLVGAGILALPLMLMIDPLLGRRLSERGEEQDRRPTSRKVALFTGLLGIFVYYAGLSVIWSNLVSIGTASGISAANVSTSLSVAMLFAIAGGGAAMALGALAGRTFPYVISVVCSIMASAALALSPSFSFLASACVLVFGWNFVQPYPVSAMSTFDGTGRVVAACVAVMLLGFAAGPLLSSAAVYWAGESTIAYVAIGLFIASIALIYKVLRISDRDNEHASI